MKSRDGYWFRSSKFEIEPGEDNEINPGLYGRQLAKWLKERLQEKGYSVEAIINEDWGRCLICSHAPFFLWVGCGSITDESAPDVGDEPPGKEDLIWHIFAIAEVPFWKRLFRKVDTGPAVTKLDSDLGDILRAEPQITLVEEP
jgi:hypothetical protein